MATVANCNRNSGISNGPIEFISKRRTMLPRVVVVRIRYLRAGPVVRIYYIVVDVVDIASGRAVDVRIRPPCVLGGGFPPKKWHISGSLKEREGCWFR